MIFPKPLKHGDRVGLAAPSSPVSREDRDRCVLQLESMGYQVSIGDCLRNLKNLHGYLAGTAKERAQELNRMFAAPQIRAIFCIRGGYGSSQIMRYLDYGTIGRNPKIFIGYSDITNLHTAFQQFCSLVTFHGPMVKSNMIPKFDSYNHESLFAALQMGERMEFLNPEGEEYQVFHEGMAAGMVTGGNLAVLARSCGTFYQPDTAGKILFLEDVGESVPSLHMYLTQMEEVGLFDHAAGILLGDFTDCTNDRYEAAYAAERLLREWAQSLSIPVLAHVRSGHGKFIGTIPFGTCCSMDTAGKRIEFLRF